MKTEDASIHFTLNIDKKNTVALGFLYYFYSQIAWPCIDRDLSECTYRECFVACVIKNAALSRFYRHSIVLIMVFSWFGGTLCLFFYLSKPIFYVFNLGKSCGITVEFILIQTFSNKLIYRCRSVMTR